MSFNFISVNTRIERKNEDGTTSTITNPVLVEKMDEYLKLLSRREIGFDIEEHFYDKKVQSIITPDIHCLRIDRSLLPANSTDILREIRNLGYFGSSGSINQVYLLGNTRIDNNIKYFESSYFGMTDQDNLDRLKNHNSRDKNFNEAIAFDIKNVFIKNTHVEAAIISWMLDKRMLYENQNRGRNESITKEELIIAAKIIYLMLYKFNVIGDPSKVKYQPIVIENNDSRFMNTKTKLLNFRYVFERERNLNLVLNCQGITKKFRYVVVEDEILYYDKEKPTKIYDSLVGIFDPRSALNRKQKKNIKLEYVKIVDDKGNIMSLDEAISKYK